MLAFSIADGQHTVRRLVKDWLPIIVALLAYDLLRGVADGNLVAIHWSAPVHADKVLGLGQVPTIRLQDALYTPGHLHFWDYAAFSFWFSHFFATLLVAVGIWLYAYQWFHRFAACIVVLAAMGLVTYVIFPAAPPWLAGRSRLHRPHLSDHPRRGEQPAGAEGWGDVPEGNGLGQRRGSGAVAARRLHDAGLPLPLAAA